MELVVLASGLGSRLGKINLAKPKCLLEVNGASILDHASKIFNQFSKVYIIGGYKHKLLKRFQKHNVKLIFNKDYMSSNMVHSLYRVKKNISKDCVVIYSDILFDPEIINKTKNKKGNVMPLKKNWLKVWKKRMSSEEIKNDAEDIEFKNGKILKIGGKFKKYPRAQYMGILKFKKKDYINAMNFYSKMNNKKIDMTSFINIIISKKILIFNYILTDKFWYEIDTIKDFKNFNNFKKKI